MDIAELERLGLYDPHSPGAVDRLELLTLLSELGATPADMSEASASGRLWQLAGQLASEEPATLDIGELAERTGFTVATVENIFAAFGVQLESHSAPLFNEADVEVLSDLSTLTATTFFDQVELGEMFRVFGSSLSRVADAAVSMYLQGSARVLESEPGELARARAAVAAAERARGLPRLLSTMLRHHFRLSNERQRRAQEQAGDPTAFRLAVGFVDVVGFTPLSAELSPGELASLVSVFENTSIDIVTRCGGQVVKHLGDEIMFVAVDVRDACEISLRLVDRIAASDLAARGGVSYGDLTIRRGDYYGPVVNVASRLVDQAVPGEVLVITPVVEAISTTAAPFRFIPAGRRMLRGFAEPAEVWTLARSRSLA